MLVAKLGSESGSITATIVISVKFARTSYITSMYCVLYVAIPYKRDQRSFLHVEVCPALTPVVNAIELYEFPNDIPIATRWVGSFSALIFAVVCSL